MSQKGSLIRSAIIPAYNEADSLPDLLQSITETVKTHGYTAEVICINDGRTDATAEVLDDLAAESLPQGSHYPFQTQPW